MAGVTGLEPATSGVTGQRSNQLSYTPRVRATDLGDDPDQVKQLFLFFYTTKQTN